MRGLAAYCSAGRSLGTMLFLAVGASLPATADIATHPMAIGPTATNCLSAEGGAEGLTCQGPDGWRVAIGYPAVGATLAFRRQDRTVPITGDHWFPVEDVGDRRQPALWLAPKQDGRRALILPVTVLHPDDRRQLVARGEPTTRPRRSRLFLIAIASESQVCLAAVVDRVSGARALSEARRAAGAIDACPTRPQVAGRISPTLARILTEAGISTEPR